MRSDPEEPGSRIEDLYRAWGEAFRRQDIDAMRRFARGMSQPGPAA
jgi:ketosteroid isomerase-like protein